MNVKAIPYTFYLAKVVAWNGLKMHEYADDIQVYVSTTVDDDASTVDRFATCLTEIAALWVGF